MSAVAPLALEVQDVRHSADSCRWYSPECIVEPGRELLGGFDLDPASDPAANFAIRADRIFTEADNGLAQTWAGTTWGTPSRVWCNPPTPPKEWWLKLAQEWRDGHVAAAIFVAYSIEQLQQSQLWAEETGLPSMWAFPVCIPKRRIPYMRTASDAIVAWHKAAEKLRARGRTPTRHAERELAALQALAPDQLVPGDSPAHASAIVGIGVDRDDFGRAYGPVGVCR